MPTLAVPARRSRVRFGGVVGSLESQWLPHRLEMRRRAHHKGLLSSLGGTATKACDVRYNIISGGAIGPY